jgi:hypothetical protein
MLVNDTTHAGAVNAYISNFTSTTITLDRVIALWWRRAMSHRLLITRLTEARDVEPGRDIGPPGGFWFDNERQYDCHCCRQHQLRNRVGCGSAGHCIPGNMNVSTIA